ncbi:hypothetical protein AXG93_4295s1730 [Marchantia polymorpha subsp. ruderalis]|uniref:Uncharacterized protein n=1 Tax=Marchantia polymorpha subsp. ruderalis TaxID=1480154 RepID=A0A176WAR9_MARPO|nr:hypothetical protein AXG93_4295s1730 [Marchantia polymorpha subsp. ruderalis]
MLFLLGEIPQRVHTMSGLGGLAEAEASDGLLACSSEVIRRTTAQQAVREMIGRPCEHRRTFRCILMAAAAMAGEQSTIASVPFRSVPQYRGEEVSTIRVRELRSGYRGLGRVTTLTHDGTHSLAHLAPSLPPVSPIPHHSLLHEPSNSQNPESVSASSVGRRKRSGKLPGSPIDRQSLTDSMIREREHQVQIDVTVKEVKSVGGDFAARPGLSP